MAAECHTRSGFKFQGKLTVDFRGGEITTDAGLVLLREFDERLGLTVGLREVVEDSRDRRYVSHGMLDLLRQRIYQIAAGYEDANDATWLRHDPTMRVVVGGKTKALASQPTLSRLENAVGGESISKMMKRSAIVAIVGCLTVSAATVEAALLYFSSRAAFDAATGGGLNFEGFEGAWADTGGVNELPALA